MFQFATPCLGMPSYLKLPCLCLPLLHFISSHFYVCVFYKKLMLQGNDDGQVAPMPRIFLPWEWVVTSLLPSLLIIFPLFLGFMLIPILHSLSSPYPPILTLLLVFTSFFFYFTPLIFTILHVSPLFFDLCVFSLFSLDLSYLTSHQNLK